MCPNPRLKAAGLGFCLGWYLANWLSRYRRGELSDMALRSLLIAALVCACGAFVAPASKLGASQVAARSGSVEMVERNSVVCVMRPESCSGLWHVSASICAPRPRAWRWALNPLPRPIRLVRLGSPPLRCPSRIAISAA